MTCVGYMLRFGRATAIDVGVGQIDVLYSVNVNNRKNKIKNENYRYTSCTRESLFQCFAQL